jgi:hypothetical protein
MRWISKEPPIYVWAGDIWYNERDKLEYKADLGRQIWHHFDDDLSVLVVPFPKKTKVMGYGKS